MSKKRPQPAPPAFVLVCFALVLGCEPEVLPLTTPPDAASVVQLRPQPADSACVTPKLTPDPTDSLGLGTVPCLVLVTLPVEGPETLCNDIAQGKWVLESATLQRFRAIQHAAWLAMDGGNSGQPDPSTFVTCGLQQLTVFNDPFVPATNFDCSLSTAMDGWCYVEGTAPGSCPQQIVFTADEPGPGATASLACNAPWVCAGPGCD